MAAQSWSSVISSQTHLSSDWNPSKAGNGPAISGASPIEHWKLWLFHIRKGGAVFFPVGKCPFRNRYHAVLRREASPVMSVPNRGHPETEDKGTPRSITFSCSLLLDHAGDGMGWDGADWHSVPSPNRVTVSPCGTRSGSSTSSPGGRVLRARGWMTLLMKTGGGN